MRNLLFGKNRALKQKESYIEKKVCEYARSKGFLSYKFVSPSQRGVPDRMFIGDGVVFFIEFKSKEGVISKLQRLVFEKIASRRISVYVCDDIEEGKRIIEWKLNDVNKIPTP